MTAPTLQASSIPPARKSRRTSLAARTATTARLARAGNQASSIPPARKSRRTSLSARTPRTATLGLGRAIRPAAFQRGAKKPKDVPVGAVTDARGGGRRLGRRRHGSGRVVAPVTDVVAAPVSDVGRAGSGHADLGCRGGRPARATALRPFFLLVGHRRGAARSGRSGRHPRPWAVGSRGCVGGVAIAAGPALCRCLGRAGDRQAQPGLHRSM